MVTSMSMCPIFGRVNRSVMRRDSVPGSPFMSSQVLPFCPMVSTTNVSLSQWPIEYPIHVGCGSLGSGLPSVKIWR